jgi:hypothetical protein
MLLSPKAIEVCFYIVWDVCSPTPFTSFVVVIYRREDATERVTNVYQNTKRDMPKDRPAKSEIPIIYNILMSKETLRTFLFVELKFLKVLYPDVES